MKICLQFEEGGYWHNNPLSLPDESWNLRSSSHPSLNSLSCLCSLFILSAAHTSFGELFPFDFSLGMTRLSFASLLPRKIRFGLPWPEKHFVERAIIILLTTSASYLYQTHTLLDIASGCHDHIMIPREKELQRVALTPRQQIPGGGCPAC